ncbi:rhodanese-like domain-containing protein [Halobacillus seohaensis]|uniref:Rhodanese-like domain-containing protein n=1 Tax=Halobacillus seohaensis TaxID=447421 RepID=A0ABW2EQS4_9BACI
MKEITPKEVAERVKSDQKVSIIDVREDEEVAQGKIPGARHIPLGQIEGRLHEIDPSKEHIMVCRSGGRSGKASEILKEKNYEVTNMTGGMLAWEDNVEE